MKHTIVILLAAVVAVGLAQSGEKVRQELEITDRMLREAEPIVEQSGVPEAQDFLRQAEGKQQDAWRSHGRREYIRSLAETKQARFMLRQALELARLDPERIRAELRRTGDLINESRAMVTRSGVRQAIELLRIAEAEQDGSRREFGARHFRVAFKLTMTARLHAQKAVQLARRFGDPEQVLREVERTDELLERARAKLQGLDGENQLLHQLQELFERARAWQVQARESWRGGQQREALKLTFGARNLLLRAWEMGRGNQDPELVAEALAETGRLLKTWQDGIRSGGDPEEAALLDKAVQRQQRARDQFAAGSLVQALGETTAARRLLNRAIELHQSAKTGPGRDNPQDE
jgi:hypothetical protein